MALLSVEDALQKILSDAVALPDAQSCPLLNADGRITIAPVLARLTQPPFDASAMDGYAVKAADVGKLPVKLTIIGEAAAGHPFAGTVSNGEAVRIFTGGAVPNGADAIVIQENTARSDDSVTVVDGNPDPAHIRPAGGDFHNGAQIIPAGHALTARDIALAAAMGHNHLSVRRKPRVAILATGDELVPPGDTPGPGQIISSNPVGLAAMVARYGAEPELLGIAKDTPVSLDEKITQAREADILLTVGGASVGDHDLVAARLQAQGMDLGFWKIAMRPGKPLMFGRLGNAHVIGLPGNPVSALICCHVFVRPLIERLLGRTDRGGQDTRLRAKLTAPIPDNGPRQHYMRAKVQTTSPNAPATVTPAASQDSSLLSLLAEANALIVRSPGQKGAEVGELIDVHPIDF